MTTFSVFFFFLLLPRMLCIMTPVFSRYAVSSLCGSLPASADARSGKRGLKKRKAKTPRCRRRRAGTLMHNARLHLLGFLCCLLLFSFPVFFLSLASLTVIRRLPGSCGVAGGGLEGGLPHGFLLQSELRAVGSQSPRQPTCAGASQTGERD